MDVDITSLNKNHINECYIRVVNKQISRLTSKFMILNVKYQHITSIILIDTSTKIQSY